MGVAGANSAAKKVKCDNPQTLPEALRKAKPGDTLQVTGTCHERVTITTGRLTLGGGNAVLDGGRVSLMGFTIQNSPCQGILGVGGAAFVVKDTTMQNQERG
jgi:polygalacturonase